MAALRATFPRCPRRPSFDAPTTPGIAAFLRVRHVTRRVERLDLSVTASLASCAGSYPLRALLDRSDQALRALTNLGSTFQQPRLTLLSFDAGNVFAFGIQVSGSNRRPSVYATDALPTEKTCNLLRCAFPVAHAPFGSMNTTHRMSFALRAT